MPVRFGTSGLRGLASALGGGVAQSHARAFARHARGQANGAARPEILVASDLRESSPLIKEQVIAGLLAEGFLPFDCGCVPTPALAHAAMARGLPCVMVTGSHIPANRNGLKFFLPQGEIGKADEAAIARIARDGLEAPGNRPAREARRLEGVGEDFLERYRRCFPGHGLDGLRVGVYEHSTLARDMLVLLLESRGAEIVRLARSDRFVALDTEDVDAGTQENLRTWSAQFGLDTIVSADGDADRPLVADENGRLMRGDLLGLIAARFLAADAVVTPVTSNSGLERGLACPVIRTRVGSPFVIEGMAKAQRMGRRAILGFEANGGALLGSDFKTGPSILPALPTRDCFLPIICALSTAAREKTSLSRVAENFALPAALAGKLENIPPEASRLFMDGLGREPGRLAAFLRPLGEMAAADGTDGLRAKLADGKVIHMRSSGNEPAVRCYVEAASEEEAEALLAAAMRLIAGFSGRCRKASAITAKA